MLIKKPYFNLTKRCVTNAVSSHPECLTAPRLAYTAILSQAAITYDSLYYVSQQQKSHPYIILQESVH